MIFRDERRRNPLEHIISTKMWWQKLCMPCIFNGNVHWHEKSTQEWNANGSFAKFLFVRYCIYCFFFNLQYLMKQIWVKIVFNSRNQQKLEFYPKNIHQPRWLGRKNETVNGQYIQGTCTPTTKLPEWQKKKKTIISFYSFSLSAQYIPLSAPIFMNRLMLCANKV